MALIDLWQSSREQLENKHVQQIIAFSGKGQLKDDSSASYEFRDFLSHVPSSNIRNYAEQCLRDSFPNSGFALQDIVNQIGRRLGFDVIDGRYRGTTGQIGYDGIWRFREGHKVIVEVKTTDAYRIDLETIAKYRRSLIGLGEISEEGSSILIIVGREDTGDLEAQIRGSRHAWDIRLISVDALLRLLLLKEEVEDPLIVRKISDILIPREFTKLDEIIEILFSTAEDIKSEEIPLTIGKEESQQDSDIEPVSFHEACIKKLEKYLGKSLVKRTRTSYSTPDEFVHLTCAVSKVYHRGGQDMFWFAFHLYQKEFLEIAKEGWAAFGCGNENTLFLIPALRILEWLDDLWVTDKEKRFYWHIHITKSKDEYHLLRSKGAMPIDISSFLVQ